LDGAAEMAAGTRYAAVDALLWSSAWLGD
jgi:hypothetical protein